MEIDEIKYMKRIPYDRFDVHLAGGHCFIMDANDIPQRSANELIKNEIVQERLTSYLESIKWS